MKALIIFLISCAYVSASSIDLLDERKRLLPTSAQIADLDELAQEKAVIADSVKRAVVLLSIGQYKNAQDLLEVGVSEGLPSASFTLGFFHERGYLGEDGVRVSPNLVEARRCYEKAVEKGHKNAQARLGVLMITIGQEDQGVSLLKEIAQEGRLHAMNDLGDVYLRGKGVKQDVEKAVTWYEKAQAKGSLQAALNLGDVYSAQWHGADHKEALRWYEKAATSGELKGFLAMSKIYLNGPERDLEKAAHSMERAVESGDNSMYYHLALLKENLESLKVALPYYTRAAEFGHPLAQHRMGDLHSSGKKGWPRDNEKALIYYRHASNQGVLVSMYKAALLLKTGEGVEKNVAEAMKLLHVSAQRGYMLAQYELGQSLKKGDGVTKDEEEALRWFNEAAKQGYAPAKFELGTAAEKGAQIGNSHEAPITHYVNAAKQGFSDACYKAAHFYLSGEVVEKSPVTAYSFLLAIKQRSPEAEALFLSLNETLSEWDKVEAREMMVNKYKNLSSDQQSTIGGD